MFSRGSAGGRVAPPVAGGRTATAPVVQSVTEPVRERVEGEHQGDADGHRVGRDARSGCNTVETQDAHVRRAAPAEDPVGRIDVDVAGQERHAAAGTSEDGLGIAVGHVTKAFGKSEVKRS